MKLLTLDYNENLDQCFLTYKEGSVSDTKNFVRECCESNYEVEFERKGFLFSEELITNALTEYFNKEYNKGNLITYEEFDKMFRTHSELRNSEETTDIKNITMDYLKSILE